MNYSWRPEVSFLGAREVIIDRVHYVTLNMDSLEPYGVTPMMRETMNLKHSAIMIMSVSATFRSPMAFSAFPFDAQTLAFRFTDFLNAVGYDFLPLAAISQNLYESNADDELDIISGWAIRGVTAAQIRIEPGIELSRRDVIVQTTSPATNYYSLVATLPALQTIQDASAVEVRLTIKRKASFYEWNYTMLIHICVILSWATFLIDIRSYDIRVQNSLTLVLALNVLQLVLSDKLPVTGYMTRMHSFVVFATFFVFSTAIESVILHRIIVWVQKHYESDDEEKENENKHIPSSNDNNESRMYVVSGFNTINPEVDTHINNNGNDNTDYHEFGSKGISSGRNDSEGEMKTKIKLTGKFLIHIFRLMTFISKTLDPFCLVAFPVMYLTIGFQYRWFGQPRV